MAKICIMGLMVTNRMKNAPQIQRVLTECGCNIKTRIGLHETAENFCSDSGLILLELSGDECAHTEVTDKLKAIQGVQVQKMVFEV
jgi:hypothetical protein